MATLPDRERLLANFKRCTNWEEKYLYLIELGGRLAPMAPADHGDANRVAGCQSQVWLAIHFDASGRLQLLGDSDAALVKGLIAVVSVLYDGMLACDIQAFSPRPWFEEMALSHHLTPSRVQGLEAIIRTIHASAAKVS